MDKQSVVVRLKLISSLAESLASDINSGRLWEGEAARKVSSICEEVVKLKEDMERR